MKGMLIWFLSDFKVNEFSSPCRGINQHAFHNWSNKENHTINELKSYVFFCYNLHSPTGKAQLIFFLYFFYYFISYLSILEVYLPWNHIIFAIYNEFYIYIYFIIPFISLVYSFINLLFILFCLGMP